MTDPFLGLFLSGFLAVVKDFGNLVFLALGERHVDEELHFYVLKVELRLTFMSKNICKSLSQAKYD